MQLLNESPSPEEFYRKAVNGGLISPPVGLPSSSIATSSIQGTKMSVSQTQLQHNHGPLNSYHSPPISMSQLSPLSKHISLGGTTNHHQNQQSCYLCTVTCCDTVNCSKSAPIIAPSGRYLHRANSDMQSKQSFIESAIFQQKQQQQQQQQQQQIQHRPASVASLRHCPICIDTSHSPLQTYRTTPPFLLYSTSTSPLPPPTSQQMTHRVQTPQTSSPTPKVKVQSMVTSGNSSPRTLSRTESSPGGRKTSFREKPKLHIFIPENDSRSIPSPDFSSDSPSGGGGGGCGSGNTLGGCGIGSNGTPGGGGGGSGGGSSNATAMYGMRHSSFTDYTDTCTPPLCSSTTPGSTGGPHSGLSGNGSDCLPDFPSSSSSTRKVALLTDADYQQLYLTGRGAEKHGFFRKAVPALPIVVAVLFCMFNLILPGSGTLLASLTIILGSQTEYGPGHGCRSFFICFLSAILQFTTAIFVFGWVWSIMWGIVFIKNSLRYGDKRDINTITLC